MFLREVKRFLIFIQKDPKLRLCSVRPRYTNVRLFYTVRSNLF